MVVVVHKPWKAGRLERHISVTFQTETLEHILATVARMWQTLHCKKCSWMSSGGLAY